MLPDTPKPTDRDETFQREILEGVSRTFALTIPQLPGELSRVVGNAYLLCRIADTIEDDRDMTHEEKRHLSDAFTGVVEGNYSAEEFSAGLLPQLSSSTPVEEKILVKNTDAVIRITHSLNRRQHAALARCIRIMADGMARYQENNVINGLNTMQEMDTYCYYVAGVVGEMLTELFCDYSGEIDKHHDELMKLSISFGQGLQMTNILKDIWDDKARNMCWLPQDVFQMYGADLKELSIQKIDEGTQLAIGYLVGTARGHLENALRYTLIIPPHESGIRHFCLWALGMAVLTLRNINRQRDFTSGQQVKISRMNVRSVIFLTNLFTGSNRMLTKLFKICTDELPKNEGLAREPSRG